MDFDEKHDQGPAGAEEQSGSQSVRIRGLLRRAQIRIEFAADDDEREDALAIITEALTLGASLDEVAPLLQRLAEQSALLASRVAEIEKHFASTPAAPDPPSETEPATRPPSSSLDTPEAAAQSADIPPLSNEQLQDLLAKLSRAYYGGVYREAIDIANRILHHHPNQPTVRDYRQKAEEGMLRGDVPDHLIPFDARVAYNRAKSLARAGSYQEAKRHFQNAQELAKQAGIDRWRDAEQAQLEIEDLALAREMLLSGDQQLTEDNWEAALHHYENALRVVPGDPQIEERRRHLRELQQSVTNIRDSLATSDESTAKQIQALEQSSQTLRVARKRLPGSARLEQLAGRLSDRRAKLASGLAEQAQHLLDSAERARALPDRSARTQEAAGLIEQARQLMPETAEYPTIAARARELAAAAERARVTLSETEQLLKNDEAAPLAQALHLLTNLHPLSEDERYRASLRLLFCQMLALAEANLAGGQLRSAQETLEALRDQIFTPLGRSGDIERLEAAIRKRQRIRRLLSTAVTGGIIILILTGIVLARPNWQPMLFPPPPTATATATNSPTPTNTSTPTQTLTPSHTPTITLTPSNTPTPTRTQTPTQTLTPSNTPTPSITPTPSNTPTPSSTPTPTNTLTPTLTPIPVLCRVHVKETLANLRTEPNALTPNAITQIPQGQELEVFEWKQGQTDYPLYWLKVEWHRGGRIYEGWIREDTLETIAECPITGS